jgi:hypothetical protein
MFPSFLFVIGVWDISSGIGPCFPLAGVLCKFYANATDKRPMQRHPLLVQNKQQSQSTFINEHLYSTCD